MVEFVVKNVKAVVKLVKQSERSDICLHEVEVTLKNCKLTKSYYWIYSSRCSFMNFGKNSDQEVIGCFWKTSCIKKKGRNHPDHF